MQVDEYNEFTSQLARYREALIAIEQLGVRISNSCRLRRYEALIQRALDDPRPALEYELVHESAFALREIDEIIEIVDNLPTDLDEATSGLIALVPGGTDNPDDEVSARAREAQYELYLGSILRRSGIPAVHGKPDLVAQHGHRDFCFEAKRPSSPVRLDDRVRTAVHQLRTLPEPGILALSLDQALRPRNTILEAPTLDRVAPAVAELVRGFVDANTNIWRKRLTGEPVEAVILTARIPARLTTTGHLTLGTNIHLEPISGLSNDTEVFLRKAIQAYMAAQ